MSWALHCNSKIQRHTPCCLTSSSLQIGSICSSLLLTFISQILSSIYVEPSAWFIFLCSINSLEKDSFYKHCERSEQRLFSKYSVWIFALKMYIKIYRCNFAHFWCENSNATFLVIFKHCVLASLQELKMSHIFFDVWYEKTS